MLLDGAHQDQQIYQKNLKNDLLKNKQIINKTGKDFDKELTKIKTETTQKSKLELLKGMVR